MIMVRRMDLEPILGSMGKNILEHGKMVNNMELVY
jgi:hypothetical protein